MARYGGPFYGPGQPRGPPRGHPQYGGAPGAPTDMYGGMYPVRMAYPGPMMPMFAPPPVPKYFSIDVECVATGPGHNDRAVAQVALVDQFERVWMNRYVRVEGAVASYLTPLTGLTAEVLQGPNSLPLPDVLAELRNLLPPHAVLVGQNIAADIRWLGLRETVDFESLIDLSGAYRVFNPKFNSYSYFSLQHEAKVLLQHAMEGAHNAMTDAIVSVRLFNLYMQLKSNPEELERARQALIAVPLEASFAKRNPSFEGVCMGNKKTCTCGQPIQY
eukprot:m.220881 g.220881  ORF g.220881 m.220881 type:complete len:274 (-) comp10474_c0_seq1:71-892(-)